MKICTAAAVSPPMRRSVVVLTLAAAGLVAAGPASAAPGTGAIKGVVTWKGAPPADPAVDRSRDPACPTGRGAEDVVVTDGKLRDVLVRIKLAAPPSAPPSAPPPAVIGQTACMYTPRVVGLVVGQKLEIRNLDPTFHNVRGNLATKILWNLGQAKGAPAIVRDNLGQPGDVVSLHCDVHPWMSAWVAIHDHPHFAVTGADGGFTLPDLAPGTYTVEAWHPTLGTKTSKLKVRRGKTTKASFTFAAPPAR